MATFKIHEDAFKYSNKMQPNIKFRSKGFQTKNVLKESKIPTARVPLRSANNGALKKNIPQIKKAAIPPQVVVPVEIYTDPSEIIKEIPKEKKVNTNSEIFENVHFKNIEKENSEQNSFGLKNYEQFYFSRDQFYMTTQEYHDSIYAYLLSLERGLKHPKFDYMLRQPELSPKMRSILVDWLSSVGEEYNMQPQTLHLAVQYLDCFLSRMSVIKNKFQLVGTAAMMIAAKYEEIYPPDIKEWAYLTADSFTPKQLLKMEQLILKVLQFDIARPTAFSFINHICIVCNLPRKLMLLAMYFSELVLLEGEDYIKYFPSKLASASVALARFTLKEEELWPEKLELKTGYTIKELSPIIKRQNKSFTDSPTRAQQSIQEKFKSPKFGRVALFKPRRFDCDIIEE